MGWRVKNDAGKDVNDTLRVSSHPWSPHMGFVSVTIHGERKGEESI